MNTTLVFRPADEAFASNLAQLRQAVIRNAAFAPKFLNVIADGKAHNANTAHVRLDGWFAYTNDTGERRIELSQVTAVEAHFSSQKGARND